MKAAEARATAVKIAQDEATKKSATLKKRRAALKASIPGLRAQRINKIETEFRQRIMSATEYGETKTEITLSQNGRDYLRGEYKYLPLRTKHTYRGEERTYYHAWGAGYLKYAAWGKYVKQVLTRLRRDGYICVVEGVQTDHDDSAAYMNSGGECGSERSYWTRDTVLRISW